MTDNDIKESLLKTWAEHKAAYSTLPISHYLKTIRSANNYKTAREIGAAMVKDDIDRVIVAKILRGE